jgi:hypothetical protein
MTSQRIEVFFYGLFMDADLLRKQGVNPACETGVSSESGNVLLDLSLNPS